VRRDALRFGDLAQIAALLMSPSNARQQPDRRAIRITTIHAKRTKAAHLGAYYASTGAMTFPCTAAEAGDQYPAMTHVVNSLTASFTVPLSDRASLRLYDYYERGQISDGHYAGFNNTLVYDNRVYIDAGPQGYNTNVVGLFINLKL
jgi:hypothetical protein